MLKSLSLCALILALSTGLIQADIYRCKDANGTLILTDAPSKFPSECQVKVIKELPPINVAPSTTPPPSRQRKVLLPPASTGGMGAQEKGERGYSSLKEEAETLVKDFHSTRRNIRHKNKVTKHKARKELTEIKAQKGRLLKEVDQSRLNSTQKKEVREVLAPITE